MTLITNCLNMVDSVQVGLHQSKAISHNSVKNVIRYRTYDAITLIELQLKNELSYAFNCARNIDPQFNSYSKCQYDNYKIQSLKSFLSNNLDDHHKQLLSYFAHHLGNNSPSDNDIDLCGDDIMSLIEDIIYLLRRLYKHIISEKFCKSDFLETIAIFLKLRLKKPFIRVLLETVMKRNTFNNLVTELCDAASDISTNFNKCGNGYMNYEPQSFEDFSDNIDLSYDIFNKITSLKDTLFYKKLKSFFLYLISFGCCEKFGITFDDLGYTALEANYLKRNKRLDANFLVVLIDTTLYVLKKGIQIIKTGDVNCIYHSGDTYGQLFDDYNILRVQTQQLHNPELFGFNISSHQALLDNTIEKYENIKKHSGSLSKFDKDAINKNLNDLLLWRTDLVTKKSCRKLRPAPFSVLFFGESGVGKTYLKEMLYNFFGKLLNLEVTPEFCFTRSPGANFWDGFRSSMWCIVLDDIAFTHPNKCPTGDPTFQDVLQIQNNQPWCPDQAALEDKGRTPMMAKLLIATTNVKSLNATQYFSHASAALRRLPIIVTPTVKKEYAKIDGMLDKSKIPDPKVGYYDDLWTFKVEVVHANLTTSIQKSANYETVLDNASLVELLKFFRSAIIQHEKDQKTFMSTVNIMQDIDLCDSCKMPRDQFCDCKNVCDLNIQGVFESANILMHFTTFCLVIYVLFRDRINNFYHSVATLNKVMVYPKKFFSVIDQIRMYFSSMMFPPSFESEETIRRRILKDVLKMRNQAPLEQSTSQRYTYDPNDPEILDSIPVGSDARRFYNPTMREYWVDLGKVQLKHMLGNKEKMCASLIGSVGVVFSLYKLYKRFFDKPDNDLHGNFNISEKGCKPLAHENERLNPWVNDNIHLSKFDLTPQITSNKSLDINQFLNRIAKDCISIKITNSRGYMSGKAVCLRGNTYITNNHNVPTLDLMSTLSIVQHDTRKGINGNITCSIANADIVRYEKRDICIIFITGIPPKKGIYDLLPKRGVNTQTNGYYVQKDWEGLIRISKVSKIKLDKAVPIKRDKYNVDIITDLWNGSSDMRMEDGFCGTVLVINTPMGRCVGGLHFLGDKSGKEVAAVALYREDYDDIISKHHQFTVQSNNPNLKCGNDGQDIVDLNAKSNTRFLENGNLEVYGSFEGFRPKHKSTVGISPLAHYLSDHGYKIKYGKPDLNCWQPWSLALNDIANPLQTFNSDILQKCTDSFIQDILSGLSVDDLSEVCIVDMFTAINGAAGVAYVDKIARNTSAGSPWNKSKRYYMHDIPSQHGLQDPVDISPEIKERCSNIIEDYQNSLRSASVFTAHVKDEPLSFPKLKAKKSRIFSGSPVDLTIVTRMYLVTIIRLIQNNKKLFESAPGIIAQSSEWGNLYTYLTKHGKARMIAGDYRKFDKTMAAKFILEAFRIIKTIALKSGNYNNDDLKVLDGIAIDTAYAWTNFNGDLVQFFGSNPSGHALTVIINGLVNCLYMRYAYICLNPQVEVVSFKQNVSLITYGDDNVAGVSERCPWYNHTSISNLFKAYGLEYTMADKDAESVPYIDIGEVSFLKRKFRIDENTNFCMAPLDDESIEKQLMVWTYSKSIEESAQAAAIVNSAVREYFFYGKEIFENKRVLLKKCLDDLSLNEWVNEYTFPTWEYLVDVYNEASLNSNF